MEKSKKIELITENRGKVIIYLHIMIDEGYLLNSHNCLLNDEFYINYKKLHHLIYNFDFEKFLNENINLFESETGIYLKFEVCYFKTFLNKKLRAVIIIKDDTFIKNLYSHLVSIKLYQKLKKVFKIKNFNVNYKFL